MSRVDPGRSYSWWWDSHITAKNSKWLHENLTDVEVKVSAMIKIIEEDADSFARRAEMYYKRRPELMKLVEEFYRAYCALAARYDHAAGDLRQAHRTISEAFPDKVPFTLHDDSPLLDIDVAQKDSLGGSSTIPTVKKSGVFSEENDKVTGRKGLKQFTDIFQGALASDKKSPESVGITGKSKLAFGRSRKGLMFQEGEDKDSAVKPNNGLTTRQRNEVNLQDKGTQYETPCVQEGEVDKGDDAESRGPNVSHDVQFFNTVTNSAEGLIKAEADHNVQTVIANLQKENHQSLKQYQDSLQRISNLESEVALAHEEIKSLNEDIFKGILRFKNAEEQAISLGSECQSLQSSLDLYRQKIISQEVELKAEHNELEELRIEIQEKHQQSIRHETVLKSMTEEHSQLQELHKGLLVELQNERNLTKDMRSALQHEIDSLKEEKNDLDRRYSRVIMQMGSIRLEVERLQSSMRESFPSFSEENSLLTSEKDNANTKEDNMMQIVQTLEVLNEGIKQRLSSLEKEKETYLSQLKELQYENVFLKESCKKKDEDGEVMSHSLKTMETVLEKKLLLEKKLSEKENDLEVSRDKLKILEESVHSLMEEKLVLSKEKENIASKVDSMMKTMQTLEALNSEVKEKRLCLEREMEALLNQLEGLQSENILLRESCNKKDDENAMLLQNLRTMGDVVEKNSLLEKTLSDKSNDLEIDREKLKMLEESFHSLAEEKSLITTEKDNMTTKVDNLLQTVQMLEALNAEVKEKHLCVEREKETMQNKIVGLESENTLLKDTCNKKNEENAVISQSLKLMESVLEKNCFLEKSLLDKNNDLETVGEKLKILEVSFYSLLEEKSLLSKEKDDIATKFNDMMQSMHTLESLNAEFKEKHLCLEREKESMFSRLKELQACLDLEREEHRSLAQSIGAKSHSLEAKIKMLLQESQHMNDKLENEENIVLMDQIEAIVVQCFLLDICVRSRDLSSECRKYQELSLDATEMVSSLKEISIEQKMQLESIMEKHALTLDQNMQLRYSAEQLLALVNTDLDHVLPNKISSEIIFHDIQNGIESLRTLLLLAQDENMQMCLERIITGSLLEQLELEMFGLSMNRRDLETEIASLRMKATVLRSGKKDLETMNELFKEKILLLERREQVLENEIGIAQRKLHDSQASKGLLEHQNDTLHEEKESLSEILLHFQKQMLTLEEDFDDAIHEALSLENLLVIYQISNIEKEHEIRKLNASLDHLHLNNYTLKEEGSVMSEKLKILEMENSHFRELIERLEEYKVCSVSLLSEVDKFRSACGQLKDQIEYVQKLLNEKEIKLSEAEQKMQIMQMEQETMQRKLEHVKEEPLEMLVRKEAVEKDLMELTIVNTGMSKKIDYMVMKEGKLKLELDRLQNKIDDLTFQEGHLESQMKENTEEIQILHTFCDKLYCDLQVSDMLCIILEERICELIGTCKDLNENLQDQVNAILGENASMNVKIRELEQENALLNTEAEKMELKSVEYLSVISSLTESIFSLQDHSFSLMGIEQRSSEDPRSSSYTHEGEVDEGCKNRGSDKRDGLQELQILLSNIQTIDRNIAGFEIIRKEYQDLKIIKGELEKELNILAEDILRKGMEVKNIHGVNEKIELESAELLRKIDQFQFREEYLQDELETSMQKIELLQRSLETLYHEHETCAIRETVVEEKWKELVGAYESLEIYFQHNNKKFLDEIEYHGAEMDDLLKKITALEEFKEESGAALSSIKESIHSLQYLCLASLKSWKMDADFSDEKNMRVTDLGFIVSEIEESTPDPKELLVKFMNVERLVKELSQVYQLHTDTHGRESLEAKEKHIFGVETDKTNSSGMHDSLPFYGSRSAPFGNTKHVEADEQMLELWETAEKNCSHKTQVFSSANNSISNSDSGPKKSIQKETDQWVSELQIEREVKIDKIEVSSESEKNKVRDILTLESNRLMDLQNNVQGLTKRCEKLRKNADSNGVEIDNAKAQLGKTELVISRLIEINNKLQTGSQDKDEREICRSEVLGRRKAEGLPNVPTPQTGNMRSTSLEKINQLEIELQKIEFLLRKLEDEHVRKQHAAVEKRARVILRDYLYGREEGIHGRRRKRKKVPFYSCIIPSTIDD